MKFTHLLLWISLLLIFMNCKKDQDILSVVDSSSFHVQQVDLHFQLPPPTISDKSLDNDSMQSGAISGELNELFALKERVVQSPEDQLWKELKQKWTDFRVKYIGDDSLPIAEDQTVKTTLSAETAHRWALLNAELLKFSAEVPFGDALEALLYGNKAYQIPDSLLKSILYTHVYDDIYINIFGSSSMEYQHTTGGAVKIIQDTNYPRGTDMILKIETGDTRLLNLHIRIPSWAVNPKVQYGNVKYVAHPGQYCEVSKKWKRGDEITVSLKN